MVRWSGPAKRDLKKIFAYIAEDSRYYARHVVQNIVDKSETLEAFPKAGRMVPEKNDPNVREIFIYYYRIIYEVTGRDVNILAIIHGKQDFMSAASHRLTTDT
ncbi:MAG: type II toxin-antitoxin system RelE/ParE family toxin [Desulfohalobiaceae bacterium]